MMEVKECKYKLPCNWCDKFDKLCDMIKPIEIELPDSDNCDHIWIYDKRVITTTGQCDYYHCAKCKAVKLVNGDITYESSDEWQT